MLLVTLIGEACWRETEKKGLHYAHEKLTKYFYFMCKMKTFLAMFWHGIAAVLLIGASEQVIHRFIMVHNVCKLRRA